LIAKSEETIIETLRRIKEEIEQGNLKDVQVGNLHCFTFNRHLYEPLIHIRGDLIEVKPVSLNEGERDFVLGSPAIPRRQHRVVQGQELYLLEPEPRAWYRFF